jgi:hypothetical protein
MMTYIARKPLFMLLRCALIPVLLITLLAGAYGAFPHAEQEGNTPHFQRYEYKLTQPVRIHPPKYSYTPSARLAHHGFTPAEPPEPAAPLLCVSLYPVIYNIVKRQRLHPLKFTSNYVSIAWNNPTCIG